MTYIVNKYILGALVPILLIGAGLYFTLYLKAYHILHPIKLFKHLTRRKKERSDISPFRALTLALAAIVTRTPM
jgi:Na+/alanine symporter